MSISSNALELQLIAITRNTPWFMDALAAVRELELDAWCIGAGAVRNMVWDALQGHSIPSTLSDVDVAFFDPVDLSTERDAELQRKLIAMVPNVAWEVTNQAAVHQWFESCFGHAVPPLSSLDEAIASWPEYATCVGLTLYADNTIGVIAPHGLNDLFALVIRRNPTRVSVETYRQRVAQKRYAERWTGVTIVPA